jgi:hypothetical protein
MLYIILFVFICILVVGLCQKVRYDRDTREVMCGIGIVFSTVVLIAILIAGIKYNSIKSTANAQLEVLNEQNEIVLAQIEPLVQQALNYESNTYKEFKLTPENIISFGSMYPQLQANAFIQSQIDIIVENQKEIKDLKLKIASLNAYRLWLFTKKE